MLHGLKIQGTQGPVKRALAAIIARHEGGASVIQIIQLSGNDTYFWTDDYTLRKAAENIAFMPEAENRVGKITKL